MGGEGKRGDRSLLTLAKLVRGIAAGEVRQFCEAREREVQALRSRVAVLESFRSAEGGTVGAGGASGGAANSAPSATALALMQEENAELRAAVAERDAEVLELRRQLRDKVGLAVGASCCDRAGPQLTLPLGQAVLRSCTHPQQACVACAVLVNMLGGV